MAITISTGVTYSGGGVSVTGSTQTFTGSAHYSLSETIPASTTNAAFTQGVSLDVSTIKCMIIKSDKALTVKTNSTSSPADTLTVAANVPIRWLNTDVASCPLTTDVTAFYVTNAGTSAAALTMSFLSDATPVI